MAQQQHLPNTILHSFDLPEWVRQKTRINVDVLLLTFNVEMPRNEEAALNVAFGKRCEQVATGYAWLKSVLELTRYKTYKPAMRHYAPYQLLTASQQEELDKRVNEVNKIYKKWHKIVDLCCRSDMEYVDVRRFSLYQLYRACEKAWVENYNKTICQNLTVEYSVRTNKI